MYCPYSFFSLLGSSSLPSITCTFCNSFTNLTDGSSAATSLKRHYNCGTHHLTLAHKHPSIPINATKCKLPFVIITNVTSTTSKRANAPSTNIWKVGWREEPGVRMLEKKSMDPGGPEGADAAEDAVSDIVVNRLIWQKVCRQMRKAQQVDFWRTVSVSSEPVLPLGAST